MLEYTEIIALGNVLNTTWGKSSTLRGSFPVGSAPNFSLKADLVNVPNPDLDKDGMPTDDLKMVVKYTTVVSFRYHQEFEAERRRFKAEGQKLVNDYVKQIKSSFKDSAGRALKVKQVEETDGCEVYQTGETLSVYTQRYRPDLRRAFYRFVAVFSVR